MQLEDFVKNQKYFSLGHLPTEQLHPKTENLSELVQNDLTSAVKIVQEIDCHAIEVTLHALPILRELSADIETTLAKGRKVWLSGCGATGRLALTLESLFRKLHHGSIRENQVNALMAGGDFALVKSVENFEDFPHYGIRHLLDLGFQDGDLLVAITEGGETPFVIGTVEAALAHSASSPWFVYCNPKEVLINTIERSRVVIENPRVRSLCLDLGPMALSGSTRLQAASAQMIAVGTSLFQTLPSLESFLNAYKILDLASFLIPIIEWETRQYEANHVVLYETSDYPIAVLTDTTERSPTFSLTPFEKTNAMDENPSLCYLSIPEARDAETAWHQILNRRPRGLEWDEFKPKLGLESIFEFDFSKNAKAIREKHVLPKKQSILTVLREGNAICFRAHDLDLKLETELLKNPLCEQVLIKNILNILSLMVMGKLGRYEGNIMAWVRASNGKLIDRTIRYLEFLMEKRKLKSIDRNLLIQKIFEMRTVLKPDEAVILKLLETFKA